MAKIEWSIIARHQLLEEYRRRLPHWRLDGATYNIIWVLREGLPELTPAERTITLNALHFFDDVRYRLYAAVVMNDHVHCILKPLTHPVSSIMHSIKSFSSKKFPGRTGEVWLDEYYCRIIRGEGDFEAKREYIVENPPERWPGIESYEWLYLRPSGTSEPDDATRGGNEDTERSARDDDAQ